MTSQPIAEPRATAWLPKVGDKYMTAHGVRGEILAVEQVGRFYFLDATIEAIPGGHGIVIVAPELDLLRAQEIAGRSLLNCINGRDYPVINSGVPPGFHFWPYPMRKRYCVDSLNARLHELGRVEIREDAHD